MALPPPSPASFIAAAPSLLLTAVLDWPPAAPIDQRAGVRLPSVPLVDLVFGVVAFDPISGCSGKCKLKVFQAGVERWIHSVRRTTNDAHTEVAIFTGRARGSIANDPTLARSLKAGSVRVIEGEFDDNGQRVAHGVPSRYVRCIMRNRWFVIRDHLRAHLGRYRFVLMTDVRDVILQADPFVWTPDTGSLTNFDLRRSVVLSGEGSGSVRTLRESKKGRLRTLECAGDASSADREMLLGTDPLNAGVTLGGAEAFLNFSSALSTLIAQVTTITCLAVKDCTDQGLYNLLVYVHWEQLLPHTHRVNRPIESSFSYTLGHKKRCPAVDTDGLVHNDHGLVPPVVHQFEKGSVGRALRKSKTFRRRLDLL